MIKDEHVDLVTTAASLQEHKKIVSRVLQTVYKDLIHCQNTLNNVTNIINYKFYENFVPICYGNKNKCIYNSLFAMLDTKYETVKNTYPHTHVRTTIPPNLLFNDLKQLGLHLVKEQICPERKCTPILPLLPITTCLIPTSQTVISTTKVPIRHQLSSWKEPIWVTYLCLYGEKTIPARFLWKQSSSPQMDYQTEQSPENNWMTVDHRTWACASYHNSGNWGRYLKNVRHKPFSLGLPNFSKLLTSSMRIEHYPLYTTSATTSKGAPSIQLAYPKISQM